MTILRKGLLVLALPLLCQAIFIGVLIRRQYVHNEAQLLAVHTKDVIAQTERVSRLLSLSQSNLRAYGLTQNEMFAVELAATESESEAELAKLEQLVRDNPRQKERIVQIAQSANARLAYEHRMLALAKSGEWERMRDDLRNLRGQPLMDAINQEIDAFREVEEKMDVERLATLHDSSVMQNWLLVGGLIASLVMGAVAAAIFSREIAGRLQVVTANTRRVAAGEKLTPLVTGSDEIRALDEQFHALADHVRAARLKERVYQEALERRAADLTRANNDLAQKSQEIEMFVYSVSHDLRSPLVNLQGFSRELGLARTELEELLRTALTPEQRARAGVLVGRDMTESVGFIQTAVTRLSGIIDALLRLSRAGRVEYHPKLLEVEPVIRRIVNAMQGTIAARGAEIIVHDLPPVWADPSALDQIFANLIGNAVNYLDVQRPGKIEIGSVMREVKDLENAQTYYVKDNGLGIAEAYLPKVFAIFQRLHGEVAAGEGVGLALVRRVIERHGGKIWVESTESVGSIFFAAFPPAPTDDLQTAVAPREERLTLTTAPL